VIAVHGRVIGCQRIEREGGEVRRVTFRSLDGEVFDLPATPDAYETARRAFRDRTPLVLTLAEEGD